MEQARQASRELTWPYMMQGHPRDPDKLGSQQILEKVLSPKMKKYKRIGFGGPKGGGKSYGARGIAFTLTYHYAIVVVIIRSRLNTLHRNHILPAKNELRDWIDEGIIRYNDKHKIFYMPSGGMVQFMHCTKETDVDQFDGVAADLYVFEEAGHYNKTMIDGIIKNNRSSDIAINRNVKYPPRSLFTFNWGGPGHSILRRWFWDEIYEDNERPEDYFFIFASLEQNQALLSVNPEYVANLRSLPKNLREAYLTGDPDSMVGTVFMIVEKAHVVRPADIMVREGDESGGYSEFKIPDDWRLMGSLDAGIGAPCSFGLYAVTSEGELYKLFTYYWDPVKTQRKRYPPEHVEGIMDMIRNFPYTDGRLPEFIAADSYAFQMHNAMGVQAGDVTWEDLFAMEGVPLYEVRYRRKTALMGLHTALHFEFDEMNEDLMVVPKLKFLEGRNDMTISELRNVQASVTDPEDIADNSVDHAIDETKNMVLCAESPPAFVPLKKVSKPNMKKDYGSAMDALDKLKEMFNDAKDSFRTAI